MEISKKQLLNTHLSNLRVTLLKSKLTVCTTDWRWLNFYRYYNKFYYICDGDGWIKLGDREYKPKKGDLLFIPAGTIQSFSVAEGPPYTMYWCHFNSNIAFLELFRWFGISNMISLHDSTELRHYFEQLIENSANDGPTTSLKIQSALFAIIAYYIDRAVVEEQNDLPSVSVGKLLDTINYIDKNLSNEITIKELSDIAHFHPNYLIRVFKKHLGKPPKRYIHERRLEKAEQLLASTDMTINEVALMTGFNEVSYFSASFKKNAGVSPSDYRNLYSRERMSL